jgi:hypothetical protein
MKSPTIMYAYAAFLVAGALFAYAMSGFAQPTALIPVGMAVVMALMGVMAGLIEKNRLVGMFGIHAGLALPVLYAAMFAFLGYRRYVGESPMYLVLTFTLLAIGSVIAFVLILRTRPRPEARG